MVLTHEIQSDFRDGVHTYRQLPSGQSRVDRVTHLRNYGITCRESAGTEPVVVQVVPRTGSAFSGVTIYKCLSTCLFPRPLKVCSGHV